MDIEKNEFSPIYDCGSCLNPMFDDDRISKIDEIELFIDDI